MGMRISGWVVAAVIGGGGAVACGGSGDATHGKTLFNQPTIGTNKAGGCSTCHTVTPGASTLLGPSLAGIETKATNEYKAKSKASAEAWLSDAITKPNEELAPGYAADIMPHNYATDLTVSDLADLTAYLATLK